MENTENQVPYHVSVRKCDEVTMYFTNTNVQIKTAKIHLTVFHLNMTEGCSS